jgi:hypothetical protein
MMRKFGPAKVVALGDWPSNGRRGERGAARPPRFAWGWGIRRSLGTARTPGIGTHPGIGEPDGPPAPPIHRQSRRECPQLCLLPISSCMEPVTRARTSAERRFWRRTARVEG